MTDLIEFDNCATASVAAAERLAAAAERRLDRDAYATLVVSGGSTPRQCFHQLSTMHGDWRRVRFVMTDERWVPADHEASNERMIREHLLVNAAADARLVAIYQSDMTVDERCDSLQAELDGTRFAASLVGIGSDGHFASLFPDADRLAAGLNPDTQHFFIPIKTDASPYDRVSLTVAALLRSDEILILCFGDDKRQVIEQAIADRDSYPVSSLLDQESVAVSVYWAP